MWDPAKPCEAVKQSRAEWGGAKAGLSDPLSLGGKDRAQRIKATPGITAWWVPRVHIDGPVRDLDVGSPHPGGGEAPKG